MQQVNSLTVLPLRDIVVFPDMIVPLFIGRDKSINALKKMDDKKKEVLLATQINESIDDPSTNDFYQTATKAKITQLMKLPDGTFKVLVEGIEAVSIIDWENSDSNIFNASFKSLDVKIDDNSEVEVNTLMGMN